jgi:hypothetical protein
MQRCGILSSITSFDKVKKARIQLGMDRPTWIHAFEFVKGILVHFVSLSQILAVPYREKPITNMAVVFIYTVCYIGWISLVWASGPRVKLSRLA